MKTAIGTPDPNEQISKHIDNPTAAKYAAAAVAATGLMAAAKFAPHPVAKAPLFVAGAAIGIYANWNVRQYLIDGARWMVEEAQRPGWPEFDAAPKPQRRKFDVIDGEAV